MVTTSVTLSGSEAAAVRRELLGLYAVHAEALHHEVVACLDAGEHGAGLRSRRAEMASVAQLLDQVGWETAEAPAEVELRGSRAVVGEVLAALFAARAEELAGDPRCEVTPESALVEVSRAFWLAVLALARVAEAAAGRPPSPRRAAGTS